MKTPNYQWLVAVSTVVSAAMAVTIVTVVLRGITIVATTVEWHQWCGGKWWQRRVPGDSGDSGHMYGSEDRGQWRQWCVENGDSGEWPVVSGDDTTHSPLPPLSHHSHHCHADTIHCHCLTAITSPHCHHCHHCQWRPWWQWWQW
jgi:hypothetical protein